MTCKFLALPPGPKPCAISPIPSTHGRSLAPSVVSIIIIPIFPLNLHDFYLQVMFYLKYQDQAVPRLTTCDPNLWLINWLFIFPFSSWHVFAGWHGALGSPPLLHFRQTSVTESIRQIQFKHSFRVIYFHHSQPQSGRFLLARVLLLFLSPHRRLVRRFPHLKWSYNICYLLLVTSLNQHTPVMSSLVQLPSTSLIYKSPPKNSQVVQLITYLLSLI